MGCWGSSLGQLHPRKEPNPQYFLSGPPPQMHFKTKVYKKPRVARNVKLSAISPFPSLPQALTLTWWGFPRAAKQLLFSDTPGRTETLGTSGEGRKIQGY